MNTLAGSRVLLSSGVGDLGTCSSHLSVREPERQSMAFSCETAFISKTVQSQRYLPRECKVIRGVVKHQRNVRHCSAEDTLRAQATVNTPELTPEKAQFLEAAKEGSLVPVFRRIFSDQLTPVLAYRCLIKENDRDSPSFLFESIEHGEYSSHLGRFSLVGSQPFMEIIVKEKSLTVVDNKKGTRDKIEAVEDPMTAPAEITSQWTPVMVEGLPEVFCAVEMVVDRVTGGWVGYFSYDTMRYVESKKLPFSNAPEDDRDLPDIHLGLYNNFIVFYHVSKLVYVVHWVHVDQYESAAAADEDGVRHLKLLVDRLQHNDMDKLKLPPGTVDLKLGHYSESKHVGNMTEEEYKAKIVEAKEHILAGDIFQIVLSQRFERRTYADPFEIYRALRVVNPSPYMIYLQAGGSILAGSSPEILTRIAQGKVVNRPLAGTRKRGKTSAEDKLLEDSLRSDEKEIAEHVMLVDLGRNDVGKVSKAGSVQVEKFMDVERYSHVMHLSSTVTGDMKESMTSWDALRAALPVGTVSGAPKVMAMQLIDKLEPTRRGPYSGGIGHVSFNGDMDIALAVRTMVFSTFDRYDTMNSVKNKEKNNKREWLVYLQAGAGIVADSDPAAEYQECVNKAAGLSRAIDLAEAAFLRD